MSTLWIRELQTTGTAGSTGMWFGLKTISLWLKNCVNYTQTGSTVLSNGTGDSLSISAGVVTLTDAAAQFLSTDVGKSVTISGATIPGNNGTFVVTTYTSATQIKFSNGSGGNETSAFSWSLDPPDSWDSVEKTGVDGYFNGSDKNFSDSVAASFVAGDIGKWILVQSANTRNCGWYKVSANPAPNTVTLDFRSGATQFPDAETGLEWKLLADGYQTPTRLNSLIRLQSPSAKAWEIELKIGVYSNPRVDLRVCLDGNWSGSKIHATRYWGVATSAATWLYAVADSYGTHLSLMLHNATASAIHNGVMVSELIPFETDHAPEDLVTVWGTTQTVEFYRGGVGATGTWWRNQSDTNFLGYGTIWNSVRSAFYLVYMLDPSYGGTGNSFPNWTGREKNARLSGVGSGTGDSIASGTPVTLTDGGASFRTVDIGKAIIVGGCTNPENNGTFIITACPSTTQIQYVNAAAVNETSAFSWSIPDRFDVFAGFIAITDTDNTDGRYEIVGRAAGPDLCRTTGSNYRTAFCGPGIGNLDHWHFRHGLCWPWPGITPQH